MPRDRPRATGGESLGARVVLALLLSFGGSGCYLSHGLEPGGPDAGVTRADAATAPRSCTIRLDACEPTHAAPVELFDEQSQTAAVVWGPGRLLIAFWAPGDLPSDGGPRLVHADLDGEILEEIALSRGYNETHLVWNPRTEQGLFSSEGGLIWLGSDGRPTAEAWLSDDPSLRGTLDIGPTRGGFAVVVARLSLETQLGTSTAPGDISWAGAGVMGTAPAVQRRWDGELRALSGGTLLRHDGTRWGEPVRLLDEEDFRPIDVVGLGGAVYTLHYHFDGRWMVRRWSETGEILREAAVGRTEASGSTRLFVVDETLLVASTHLVDGAPIVLAELDPDTLEVGEERFEVVPATPTARYNRQWISVAQTPRGLAVTWTEGAVGAGNLRPYLRVLECCAVE